MASGNSKRRSTLVLPPGQLARSLQYLRRADVLMRLGLCVLAAVLLWIATGAWQPQFAYRTRYTPPRSLVARVKFKIPDDVATQNAREEARRVVPCVYSNDVHEIEQLEQTLTKELIELAGDKPYKEVKARWLEFVPKADLKQAESKFQQFHTAIAKENLESIKLSLQEVFAVRKRDGLLQQLEHQPAEGMLKEIEVHPLGTPEPALIVATKDVRWSDVSPIMQKDLTERLEGKLDPDISTGVAEHIFHWLKPRLSEITTLKFEREETAEQRKQAVQSTKVVLKTFEVGDKLANAKKPQGIVGGLPLDDDDIALLKIEHKAYVKQLKLPQLIVIGLSDFGMYLAMFLLCSVFVAYRQPHLLNDLRHFLILLFLTVAVTALAWVASENKWRAELVPLLLFGLTISIAYRQEMALLLSSVTSLILVVSLGQGLPEFVILVVTISAAILMMGRIRSRTKLLYLGLVTGVVSLATTLGVGTLAGQPLWDTLIYDAVWFGLCSLFSALVMTALLPFVEKLFDVQTDLSLLEMGDVAHPLLHELVRRAPGTYNHSINVASIAEAAAEAIGGNGLLVRVGAYFHDIGKMLKPGYFIENQGQDASRHDSLLPAMSTLVIIAHVKDGADLARQHHLPKSIIDFIQQHHGTTLVEYFYRQESVRQKEEDPTSDEVDESSFRYPGPKPQTKEAAVMMLADTMESASRVLVDPTPSRIENLVHDLTMKRLLDGQFDECNLTLKELHVIEGSLVKSLTAVYHGRVKYPEPQTA